MTTDIYKRFIETKSIKKDINFFYNNVKELIINDLYPKYLRSRRLNRSYEFSNILNSLSDENSIKLCFSNDMLNINICADNNKESGVFIKKMEYEDFKMIVVLDINIFLKDGERKNKIIFPDNKIYHNLQKTFYLIKEEHKKFLSIDEIGYNEYIQNNIKNLIGKSSNIEHLYQSVLIATDPNFKKNMSRIDPIILGIKTDTLETVYSIIHKMKYYINYEKGVKISRIRKNIGTKVDCDEIKSFALGCFNHIIEKDNDDCNKFLCDVVSHYNQVNSKLSFEINKHITKIFERKEK